MDRRNVKTLSPVRSKGPTYPHRFLGGLLPMMLLLPGCGGAGPGATNETGVARGNLESGNASGSADAIGPSEAPPTEGAGSANPQQNRWLAQATAFVRKPEQQRDLETALRARASTHPAFCPTASFVPKRIDIAFDPEPQFADDGTMRRGTIVYRSTMQGCSVPILLTVYIEAAPGMPLRFRAGVAGTTFADPDLQERAIPQAVAAARPLVPGCARLAPIDTRLIGGSPSASGALVPWSEYWLVSGCDRIVNVKLDFTPDRAANRMLVRADPTASRLMRTGGSAVVSSGAAVDTPVDPAGGPPPPSGPAPAGTGSVVASATGTSVIPLGGADIPGAKIAGTCLTKLRDSTPLAPDHVECPIGLAPRPGATTACSASKGPVRGSMRVAVSGLDRAGGTVAFQCVVRKP